MDPQKIRTYYPLIVLVPLWLIINYRVSLFPQDSFFYPIASVSILSAAALIWILSLKQALQRVYLFPIGWLFAAIAFESGRIDHAMSYAFAFPIIFSLNAKGK